MKCLDNVPSRSSNIRNRGCTTTPSVRSTTSSTSPAQRHQIQRPCPTLPMTASSTCTASSWCHQVQQSGPATTDERDTSSWSQQTTNNKLHQQQRGATSTASSREFQQPSRASSGRLLETSWQATHFFDYNLVSLPQHVNIASIISMVQHNNIRQASG